MTIERGTDVKAQNNNRDDHGAVIDRCLDCHSITASNFSLRVPSLRRRHGSLTDIFGEHVRTVGLRIWPRPGRDIFDRRLFCYFERRVGPGFFC